MTSASASSLARLSPRASFLLQASITLAFLTGSSAPTSIYPLYQAAWGFAPVTITIIFGTYAVGVLLALLVVGRLSDHVGRRPVLMVATVVQVLAMAILASADGVAALLIGRLVQGLSAGAAIAAVGAGLLDIDKARGTVANAVVPLCGTALGGLVGGLVIHFLPWPTHLVYLLLGGVFALQFVGLLFMPETISPRAGALASLKPELSAPAHVRGALLRVLPIFIATWALVGFFASLGPALVTRVFGLDGSLVGGLLLALLAGCGALAVTLMRAQSSAVLTRRGAAGLVAGTAVVLAAIVLREPVLFFLGAAVAGCAFGIGFQGAIRMVMPLARPHERAGVLSIAFVACYLAMALPVVVVGLSLADGNPFIAATHEFGGVIILLSLTAWLGTFRVAAPSACPAR